MVAYDICNNDCENCPIEKICDKLVKSYKEILDEEIAIIEENSQGTAPLKLNKMEWPIVTQIGEKEWMLTVKTNKVNIKLTGEKKEDVISTWNEIVEYHRDIRKESQE